MCCVTMELYYFLIKFQNNFKFIIKIKKKKIEFHF